MGCDFGHAPDALAVPTSFRRPFGHRSGGQSRVLPRDGIGNIGCPGCSGEYRLQRVIRVGCLERFGRTIGRTIFCKIRPEVNRVAVLLADLAS
ncbi:hypothetical protein [Bifidobacterium vespertilionis]|uniref:Uncharacterized protein n=1 Tax=Bifidobacterium vespertilionis TaxID=2562524 RepID=A0A5J5E0V0_9BIFI|nr:hypothetical protein [Bifidobacterium vespertilionis]KAA8822807.1 hypothetical protein EM848_08120 [Bifidobacterium vespertilionis]